MPDIIQPVMKWVWWVWRSSITGSFFIQHACCHVIHKHNGCDTENWPHEMHAPLFLINLIQHFLNFLRAPGQISLLLSHAAVQPYTPHCTAGGNSQMGQFPLIWHMKVRSNPENSWCLTELFPVDSTGTCAVLICRTCYNYEHNVLLRSF